MTIPHGFNRSNKVVQIPFALWKHLENRDTLLLPISYVHCLNLVVECPAPDVAPTQVVDTGPVTIDDSGDAAPSTASTAHQSWSCKRHREDSRNGFSSLQHKRKRCV